MPDPVETFERDADFDFALRLLGDGGGVVWRALVVGAAFLLADDPQPASNAKAAAITTTLQSLR